MIELINHRKLLVTNTTFLIVFIVGILAFTFFSKEPALDADSYIVAKMEQCSLASTKKSCLTDMAKDLLDHFSIREILAVFATHEREKAFFTTCHEAGHYLGQEAYKRIGSVAKIFEQSDETCIGGIFHGAIEGYFMTKNLILSEDNAELIAREVINICQETDYGEEEAFRCRHGLGHALLYVTNDEVPKALFLCDSLPTSSGRDQCYTGVFMQNLANFRSQDHPNAMLKEDDPLYPCNILSDSYQTVCYTYAVPLRFQHDPVQAMEICRILPQEYRNGCFMTFGRDGSLISSELSVLKERCEPLLAESFYTPCIVGLAGQLVIRYGIEADLPFQFCNILNEKNQSSCYGTLGWSARRLLSNEKEIMKFCSQVDHPVYRKRCMEGNSNV